MANPADALQAAIAALEGQRAALGDATVDAALAPLRAQLQALAQGTGAAAAAPSWRQLRQVSIVFLDVAGSTQLSGRLDVEEWQALIDGTLAACGEIVHAHGGEVLQYAGDNLLAAFGAAGAREDDAERAVRAALALAAEGARRGAALRAQRGLEGLAVRVGVHTGPVLRGGGVDGDNTLRGLAVNVAARMEQTAPAGRVRASHDTWSLVRGLFDAEPQEPIAVKGVEAPVRSWLVNAEKPRQFLLPTRGIDGVETPLVGRDAELAALDAAFEATLAGGRPHAVTLLAEAGLGKSRLLHEFQRRLAARAERVWLLRARSQPADARQPYGVLRALLARRLEIADSDSAERSRASLVEGLAPWLDQPGDPAPELLGQLVGMDFGASEAVRALGGDARLLRDRALAGFARWMQRMATRDAAAVVLMLDDLHWADEASLDALPGLLRQSAAPVFAVCGARPALPERRPNWGEGLPEHRQVTLATLDAAARGDLTAALLRRLQPAPPDLLALIESRSEGNPFYAEELVKMLLDRGVIEAAAEGPWRFAAARLDALPLPATLTGVLQARLDALAPDERRALQLASIVGPVFWDEALRELDDAAAAQLPPLRRKALVQQRPTSAFEGTDEEAFHHHLLHQATYDTVLPSERRQGHAHAAAWLERRVGDRAGEYLAVTAEHFLRAGDHLRAREWFDRAAGAAHDRMALKTAADYLDRALALPEAMPPALHCRLLHRRLSALDALGRRERQAADVEQLLALATEHGLDDWRAKALMQKSLLADRLGRGEEAVAVARQVLEISLPHGDAARCALAFGQIAWYAVEHGDHAAARAAVAQGLRHARAVPAREPGSDAHLYEVQLLLISVHLHASTHAEAARARALERALRRARRRRLLRMEAVCLEWLVRLLLDHAEPVRAAAYLEQFERLAAELGVPMLQVSAHEQRARLGLLTADHALALREAATAEADYLAIGAAHYANHAREVQAAALLALGRADEALVRWQRAHEVWLQLGDAAQAAAALLRGAEARLAAGDPAAALADVRGALPRLEEPGGLDTVGEALAARLAAWRVLAAHGDPGATAQLAQAWATLDQRLQRLPGAADRIRVLWHVPLHRAIAAAATAAGLATPPSPPSPPSPPPTAA